MQTRKIPNVWKLTHLNDGFVREEITSQKYVELKDNERTNLWDKVKAVLRRKFIALSVFLSDKKV